ncbi:MAG: hypothetical protein IPF99_40870 [Deltaproteobacteria bacterium]|nr:hypothetical protein [Deltaproteobacteria bacterium]
MSDKAKPEPTPVIWVFGGGITGLTVAHECIERGYDVYLVEPSEDSWEAHLPAVGGVARTQWAYIPSGEEADAPGGPITRALPFVRHPAFDYTEKEVIGLAAAVQRDGGAPDWKEVKESLASFSKRLIAATRGAGYQSLTVALTAPLARQVESGAGAAIDPSDEAIEAAVRVRAAMARELHAGSISPAKRRTSCASRACRASASRCG